MIKLLIMIALLFIVSGASSNRTPSKITIIEPYNYPISKKVDSINRKAAELDELIKQSWNIK